MYTRAICITIICCTAFICATISDVHNSKKPITYDHYDWEYVTQCYNDRMSVFPRDQANGEICMNKMNEIRSKAK